MPRVTIILVSYNQAEFLEETLASISAQTFKDFEVVAVDNGSTDVSPSLLKDFAERDKRVRIFLHATNEAISKRFNQAVREAKGEFVSFIYSDDLYLPRKLEVQVRELEKLGPEFGVAYSPGLRLNDRTKARSQLPSPTCSGDVLVELLTKWPQGVSINMLTPLVRRDCLLRHPFNENVFAEGEAIFHRIATTHRFHFHPEPLTLWRDHGRNAGKAIIKNHEIVLACLESLEKQDLPDAARAAVIRARTALCRNAAWCVARLNGDPSWIRLQLRNSRSGSALAMGHPRAAGAWLLAALPLVLRTKINRLASRLRGTSETTTLVADYK